MKMHAETLALQVDVKRRFYRRVCDACNAETLHHGWKCTGCGHYRVNINPQRKYKGGAIPYGSKSTNWLAAKVQRNSDRKAEFARKAAESRAKFGSKS